MEIEKIVLLEATLDHLTGEELGQAIEVLSGMNEILDVIFLHGTGKKNRPSGLIQVLCRPEHEPAACQAVFRHTHTLGLRRQILERYVLERRKCTVKIDGMEIPAKAHMIAGTEYLRPEADAIKSLAYKNGAGTPALRFCLYKKSDTE